LPPYSLTSLVVRRGVGNPQLWIGTDGAGALIYQGGSFEQLLPENFAARKVSTLLALENGRVFLGTVSAGVYTSDGKTLSLLNPVFQNAKITALGGNEDAVWIGTRDSGVWAWRAGTATNFQRELPDRQILSLLVNGSETWVGTPLGVAEFSNDNFQRSLAEGAFARSLAFQSNGLWIGTLDSGALKVSLPGSGVRAHQGSAALLPGIEIRQFVNVGKDLFALTPTALFALPSGKELKLESAFELTDNHISSLFADAQNKLWIGYFDRGLDIVPLSGKLKSRHVENDLVFCVNRIKEDPRKGNIAVATANGLGLFDSSGELRQVLNRKSGLIADQVSDVLFARNQMVIATAAGLSFTGSGSVSSLSGFQGLVNNHVYTLAAGGVLLMAGTLGGISLLRDGRVQSSLTTANSSLRENWITASAASDDAFYLGTYGSGVIRLEANSTLTYYRDFAKRRVEINPNALLVTSKAVLAGTAGNGLAVLTRGEERWRLIRDGFPSLNITAVGERNGVLYIGSDNGVVSIQEQNLH
jgi:ligand-binding sensor domain-containing protein